MEELRFMVEGSAPEPYEVRIVRREGGNLSAYCTCPAGANGMQCKHRMNILLGSPKNIVGGTAEDLERAASWVRGSDVAGAIEAVEAAEERVAAAKKALADAKHALGLALLD